MVAGRDVAAPHTPDNESVFPKVHTIALAIAALLAAAPAAAQNAQRPDPFEPIRFFEGTWRGTSEGEPGKGSVERTYTFVLKNRFIQERNVSTYPPQAANAQGEVHEHWSFFSHDRKREALVLRQFHQESFVLQFVMVKGESSANKLVFDSEGVENAGTWRARETYELISNDEFIETFEMGAPGKPLHVYSKAHFKRAPR
jgi:hypothetical protein